MSAVRIFHLAERDRWERARTAGDPYVPAEFEAEGFIHCSPAHQLVATANLHYPGRRDLMLLVLDAATLGDTLVWEPGTGDRAELFPHIYGPIELAAVVESRPVQPGADGAFAGLP